MDPPASVRMCPSSFIQKHQFPRTPYTIAELCGMQVSNYADSPNRASRSDQADTRRARAVRRLHLSPLFFLTFFFSCEDYQTLPTLPVRLRGQRLHHRVCRIGSCLTRSKDLVAETEGEKGKFRRSSFFSACSSSAGQAHDHDAPYAARFAAPKQAWHEPAPPTPQPPGSGKSLKPSRTVW
jgi:hypothetical protein